MRIRRLLELLINLVLFSSTNDQAYYRHLLLLEDLAHNSGMDKDLYDFWGQSSLRIQDYTKSQIQWIHDAESKVDLVSCWYLKNQRPILRSTVKQLAAENILSSFRSRFKQALLSLTNTERITCGYSYYWIFGTSSENIHFRSSRLDNNLSLDEWRMHIQRIGLLIYLIIDRCYQIMGKPVASQCEEISKSLENEARSSSIIRDKTVGVYELGDLVFAYGERSKIIEIKNSPYGYRTYKVNYLDDKQNKVKEDWCPAPYIQPYQPMKIIFKK
ncbi:hypothetical protein ABFB09_07990 [Dehalogenimonas sp. THU2]|uniref:hypothetical protein n=1 Tax=Dehalogenimonas sp. THU2 TaxID=3151121 RepID=UPI0032187D9D